MLDFILTLHKYNVYLVITAATIAGILGMIVYFTQKPSSGSPENDVEAHKSSPQDLLDGSDRSQESYNQKPVIQTWRIMLIITLILGLLQAVFGLTMIALGAKPGGGGGPYQLHYVYGAIVALGIPLVWLSFSTNGKDKRKDLLFYSIALLVMAAAAVRAWMTGDVSFHFVP